MKARRALLVSALLVGSIAIAAGPASAPYDVLVSFDFATASGDVGFREELELQLLSELRRSGCFRTVDVETGHDETAVPQERLGLRVTVIEVFEETTYDVSTAQRADPNGGPGLELAHTARFRARIEASLEHPASGRSLRSKRIGTSGAHRPMSQYDDARHMARREALLEMVRQTRIFACKGGVKRLNRELAR